MILIEVRKTNLYIFLIFEESGNFFKENGTIYMKKISFTHKEKINMENKETIGDYRTDTDNLDIDTLISKYYRYVYTIVNNFKNQNISEEDMEEIISDTFIAIWNSRNKIKDDVIITSYLVGIIKNVICKKYRDIHIEYSINDYEEIIPNISNIEETLQLKEQSIFIEDTLKSMKREEYNIFIMFYYEGKKINDIAKILKISTSKVKVKLHRIRKKIKKSLIEGGYKYG